MPLTVIHSFVSSKPEGTDATKVRTNDWNAHHTITGTVDPVGPSGAVQFNSGGLLAGNEAFSYDGTSVHIGPDESTLPSEIQGWTDPLAPLFISKARPTNTGPSYTAMSIEYSGYEPHGLYVAVEPQTRGGWGIQSDVIIASSDSAVHCAFYSAPTVIGGISASSYVTFWANTVNFVEGASLIDAYGLKVEDQQGATNNYAIKTGKGLVEFGDAGDAAGTVGLHIMGNCAFDTDGSGTTAQLFLDVDGYPSGGTMQIALANRLAVQVGYIISSSLSVAGTGLIESVAINNPGAGYVVGELIIVIEDGSSNMMRCLVVSADGSGGVNALEVRQLGSGYTVATGIMTGSLNTELVGFGTGYSIGDTGNIGNGTYVITDVFGEGSVNSYTTTNTQTGSFTSSVTTGAGNGFAAYFGGVGSGLTVDLAASLGGGFGYAPGDTVSIDSTNTTAIAVIDTVDGSGAVLTYHLTVGGTGYSTTSGVDTVIQSGIGTGLLLDITAVGTTSHTAYLYVRQDGLFGIDADDFNASLGYAPGASAWYVYPGLTTPFVITSALTVSTLPASPVAGQRAFVTDSNTAVFHDVVAAGGTIGIGVIFDGINWTIG